MTSTHDSEKSNDSQNSKGPKDSDGEEIRGAADEMPVRDSQWVKYQPWLRLQARLQIDAHFRGKFDESDIAQQTMIEAWRSQSNFRGDSEPERIAWLRQILARVLGHEVRRFRGTQKRDIAKERSLEQSIAESSRMLGQMVAGNGPTPSQVLQQNEEEALLAAALERLPKEYREVIIRRNMQLESHEQIAQALDRSVAAVRMLWVRALKRLKQEMERL